MRKNISQCTISNFSHWTNGLTIYPQSIIRFTVSFILIKLHFYFHLSAKSKVCDYILHWGWLRAVAHRATSAICKWRTTLDTADAPPAYSGALHKTPLPLRQPHCQRSPFPPRPRFISNSLFDVRPVLLLRSYCIAECVHRTAERKVFFRKVHYSRQNCKGSLRQSIHAIARQLCPCTSAVFRVVD